MVSLLRAAAAAAHTPAPVVATLTADLEGHHHKDRVTLRMDGGDLVLEVSTASGKTARQRLGPEAASFRLDGTERQLWVGDVAHAGKPFILASAQESGRVFLYVLRWAPEDPNGPLLSAYSRAKMFVSDAGRPPDAITVSSKDGTVTAAGIEHSEEGGRPALFRFRWSEKEGAFEPAEVEPAPVAP